MSATAAAWIVLAAPLAGTIVTGALFRRLPGRSAGWIGTAAVAVSFVFALITLANIQSVAPGARELTSTLWTIAGTTGVDARATILVDPLSVLMICVVAGVSMLIHLYSVSYLAGDRGYSRFFAYLNFFVFSMLLLVLAGNFLLLIVGWAFVGAASYMLISFWYRRTTATSAGFKAFVINVLGDIGLVLGTFFIFRHTGTFDLLASFHKAPHVFASGSGDVTAGCLLLLVGAFAKSAQIPLHTWLPDAMEGPTPVSALIHAATMVTAGVYLIARMHPLFQLAPAAGDVGAVIGCLTLLIAGTIGLAATDLKRVIAYSTMSQIGYMIMGVSIGAYTAGLFHLMTHAFFKALLFMAAGSLISAMGGVQSLDRMSGFRRALPFTFACFIVGGLALSGVPPFSGYFSKDSILLFAAGRGGWHWALWAAGYVGALLTALYTFRMIFRAFLGEPCAEARELVETGHLHHPEAPTNPANGEIEDTDVGFPGPDHAVAERAIPMRAAMGILALLAIVGGIVSIPHVTSWLDRFLAPTFADSTITSNTTNTLLAVGLILGAVVSIGGIAAAYLIWVARPQLAGQLRERFAPVATLFENKWYFDELIDTLVVRPGAWFGRFSQNTFERVFVNGLLVGGSTGIVRASSALVRATQSGMLRVYAALMLLGAAAVAFYFLLQS
ncbi:MAG TPA: NADH-quinone oxidoreductase subunit L [Solirubrobacteraceae bacterium]|nr:NADH-quinone oxidoreductase subunit L [Solirubrobacteraceae bacterium]